MIVFRVFLYDLSLLYPSFHSVDFAAKVAGDPADRPTLLMQLASLGLLAAVRLLSTITRAELCIRPDLGAFLKPLVAVVALSIFPVAFNGRCELKPKRADEARGSNEETETALSVPEKARGGRMDSKLLVYDSLQKVPTRHHGIAGFEELQKFGMYVRCRYPL